MATKTVSSTDAQNNFGQVLDDVVRTRTRYIVKRRGTPQAVVLSFEDFIELLNNETQRQDFASVLKELSPVYSLGEVIEPANATSTQR
ncbi:MAG: type II toxin-antitoxin system Phd/YefM family antitoxin [Chloroflexia bacterium]